MTPADAAASLAPGDVALGRLDVRKTLDGIDDGLWALGVLAARGVTVLNSPGTLIATHDKLVTARLLRRSGLPHPWTRHVRPGRPLEDVHAPVVVKPRHGSWGRNVVICETDESLVATLEAIHGEAWYIEHGALVQEVVPPTGSDLRVIVAGDRVVGAVRREAAPGEWRTNVALGAKRVPVMPDRAARLLALAAARATNAALVGVDLLPTPDGGYTIARAERSGRFHPRVPIRGRHLPRDRRTALPVRVRVTGRRLLGEHRPRTRLDQAISASRRSPRGERAGATSGAAWPRGPAGSRRGRRGRRRPPR